MSQNLLCNQLITVINQKKILERDCENVQDLIRDERKFKAEKEQTDIKLKLPKFYKDFIDQLVEKLELLKLVAYDYGKESLGIQAKVCNVERLIEVQDNLLKKIDIENCIFERATNEKIHKLRESFLKKYEDLSRFKGLYVETENSLQKSFDKIKAYDRELVEKKNLLAHYKCCIKRYQKEDDDENIVAEIQKLQEIQRKVLKKTEEIESILKCIREKICRTENETEVTRKAFKQKLNIVKGHDCYTFEQILKRKQFLELNIRKFSSEISKEDCEIKELQNGIEWLNKSINGSENYLQKLNHKVDRLNQEKLTGRRYLLLSKYSEKLPVRNILVGRDYIGSTFVITN